MEKSEEQEMQQKVVLFQLLQTHLEELKKQSVMLEAKLMEFEATKQALSDFKSVGERDMLIPLGSGCYMEGRSAQSTELLVSIGANLMLKKPAAETAKLLDERIVELQEFSGNLQQQMTSVMGQMTEIAAEFEKMKG